LITTGILLGIVLLVMVGEQAQEMQLAHWISTTPIASLVPVIPKWAGLWFSVYPTYETLIAQTIAAVLVVGSYYAARKLGSGVMPVSEEPVREAKAEAREAIAEELQPIH
jgi:high-affinity iron transporter